MVPYGFFAIERGLRQGDPIFPPAFRIFLDLLSSMLAREEMEGRINVLKCHILAVKHDL